MGFRSVAQTMGVVVVAGALSIFAVAPAAAAVSVDPNSGPMAGGTAVDVVVQGVTFTSIDAGFGHSLALGDDGNTYAWGYNSVGQIGDGTTSDRFSPVEVSAPAGVEFTMISAGGSHSLALGDDGNTYAWGANTYGQLGDGTTVDSAVPVAVSAPAGVRFTRISAGGSHSLALGDDGNAYAWGRNAAGQLGDGLGADSAIPVLVALPAGVTFTDIDAGDDFSLALGDDGATYAWGINAEGQLGNGAFTSSALPVLVSAPTGVGFTDISAGASHSLARGDDGNTYAWGANFDGALGNGTIGSSAIPVLVSAPAGVTFISVAAARDRGFAVGDDGNAYAWGSNFFGALGDGTDTNSTVPVAVSVPAGVTFVSLSADVPAFALGDDGNTYAWGSNSFGTLGDGSTIDRWTPVQITGVSVSDVTFGGTAGTALSATSQEAVGSWRASVVTPAGVCGLVDVSVTSSQFGRASTEGIPAGFEYLPAVPMQVTASPSSATADEGAVVALTATAAGDPVPTLMWQRSTDSGATWQDTGDTDELLEVTVGSDPVQYRAAFTACGSTVYSDAATIAPSIPVTPTTPGSPTGAGSTTGGSLATTGGQVSPGLWITAALLIASGGGLMMARHVFRNRSIGRR